MCSCMRFYIHLHFYLWTLWTVKHQKIITLQTKVKKRETTVEEQNEFTLTIRWWLVGSCWNNFNWIFSTNSFIYLFIHLNFANINRDYFFLKWETTKRKWFFFFLTHSKEDCSRFNMKFSFDCWFRTTVDLYYSIQRFTMCFYFFSFSLRHTIHTQICTHTYTHTRTHAPRSFILWRRTYTFAFASMVFSLNVPSVVWILMLNMVH